MRQRNLVLLMLAVHAIYLPQRASAQAGAEATGQAPIVNQDRARARARALEEAMRRVVEQATLDVLGPEEKKSKESLLRLRIYPRARTFIPSYRILEEGDLSGSPQAVFQIRIVAQVASEQLVQELSQAAQAPNLRARVPGAVILCVKASAPSGADGSALGGQILAWARDLFVSNTVELGLADSCEGESFKAQLVRRNAAWGVVVSPGAVQAESIRGTELQAAHVSVAVALQDLKQVVARSQAEADAYGSRMSIATSLACSRALDSVSTSLRKVLAEKSAERDTGNHLNLRIVNLRSYSDLQVVWRSLRTQSSVSHVELRRFALGVAELSLQSTVNPRSLADKWQSIAAKIRSTMAVEADGSLVLRLQNDDPQGR